MLLYIKEIVNQLKRASKQTTEQTTEMINAIKNRTSDTTVIKREVRNTSMQTRVDIPKDAYGAVVSITTHGYSNVDNASLINRIRMQVDGRDTIGWETNKVVFSQLVAPGVAILPNTQLIYLCPEAMYLEEYPPDTNATSTRFSLIKNCPVRLLPGRLRIDTFIEGDFDEGEGLDIEMKVFWLT